MVCLREPCPSVQMLNQSAFNQRNILAVSTCEWLQKEEINTSLPCSFPGGSGDKESACKGGDLGSIPRLGRSSGGRCGNPLQYSCLENIVDRGA